jgi:hypothetical protein
MMNVLFWRSIDGQKKSSGFVLCNFLFSFWTAIQNRVDSSGIWNPLYFYFVEANKKNPADSGIHWNMADSSGFQWNRIDANALLTFSENAQTCKPQICLPVRRSCVPLTSAFCPDLGKTCAGWLVQPIS